MSNFRIPLSDLDYGSEEEAAVQRVLKSKWLSMGPEVQAFEHEFAESMGVKYAIAVANGTAALHLAMLALGIGPKDEVIQPAINFVATANMTVASGATPIFPDIISIAEPTISPDDIERSITEHTKAVVIMHYGGYLCRMAEIVAICKKHNLALIEDACHAVGAQYETNQSDMQINRKAGCIGDIGCFSFFSNKNLATGEGGMIVTDRDDLVEQIQLLRSHGMTTLTWDRHRGHASSYDVFVHGYNYRMDEIRAALGRVQLGKLQANNQRRKELVSVYRQHLVQHLKWTIPFTDYPGDSAYHLMTLVAPDSSIRNSTVLHLREAGIQTSLHYPCITSFRAFNAYCQNDVEQSLNFAQRTITLPLFPTLSESQVAFICSVLNKSISELNDVQG